jgi:small subunit ribosomal protein S2
MTEVKKEVSKKAETQNISFQMPELIDLLKAGVHFGHKKSAWNPRMKKYIYEERNGIHIIDLVKSREILESTLVELGKLSQNGNILIVGTKGQAASIVQNVAEESGMFYINKRWMGGLFTNFDGIKKSVQGLIKMEEQLAGGLEGLVKKEKLLLKRDVERLNRIYSGIKFMDKLPEAIIVIDSQVEKNAIKEARKVKIPIIALIDTNCNPDLIEYPIPANDDSIKSITLFVNIFGEVVGKSTKALSIVALRRDHEAKLLRIEREYQEEKERKERMEEQDRERMKALREGKVDSIKVGSVVRVVKKEKDLDADIKAAEEVKKITESKQIEDLGLSARTVKALKVAKIKTVSDLKAKSNEELLAIKGIGSKAAEEIVKAIK